MPDAIIDACCLIDLYASGRFEPILAVSGFRWHVPSAVVAEARYVHQPSPDDPSVLVPAPLDLAPAISTGVLVPCDPDRSGEPARFVAWAAVFRSDGEAACLAVAESRGWTLATDDRKARREAATVGVPVVTTPELVKVWADATSAAEAEIVRVLQNIQTFARFVPHKTMPLYQWWLDAISGGGS